jgi:hypothetical protein
MPDWFKGRFFRVCPKSGRIVGLKPVDQLPALALPLVGLLALVWYAVRVVPKPSRATYPCQQMAKPLAGSFLIWLFGMTGATLAFRHAGAKMRQARFASAALAVVVGLVGVTWAALSLGDPAQASSPVAPVAYTPHTPNSPIGVAKGFMPGRVVWTHDPQVTTWDGATTSAGNRWYDKVDQGRANDLMRTALLGYADATTTGAAWDAIFRNFNGGAPYEYGEKVFIKVNLTTSYSDGCADANYNWSIGSGCGGVSWISSGNSPQLINALLHELVNVVGVAQSDITIGDPTGLWVNELYNKIQPNYPQVKYLDARGTMNRTHAARSNVRLYWSAPSGELAGKGADYIQQAIVDAKYMINLSVLKSHTRNGITVSAKNHYGSISGGNGAERKPTTSGYYNIHARLPLESEAPNLWPARAQMGQYRPLVDLNGHAQMGGKTLLYLVDGIYGGKDWNSATSKWGFLPFCSTPACATADKSWPGSLLLSMDQVALDSVAFDLLSLKTEWPEVLQAEGVQDYLHEMALADNPPSGTFYDPEGDGTRLTSMGVHEHWNNATEKKYSRNLGTGNGIELLYLPKTALTRKTATPITIDGAIDAAWAGASQEPFVNTVLGSVSNTADLSGRYRALYDDANLYLLVEVTDEKLIRDSTTWYHDDCIEVMIDGDFSRGTAYDGVNDFELGWRWNDSAITPGVNSAPVPPGVTFSIVSTGSGWLLETALPLSGLGIQPGYGRLFGLDVHVNDDDTGGDRDAKMTWKAQVDDSWQYPYRLGAGRLAGPAAVPVKLTVTGGQVRVEWVHASWNTLYALHRNATPYFTPAQSNILQDFNAPTDEYLDTPPAGPQWYYLLRSSDNGLWNDSNAVGKFDFELSAP